MVSESITFHAYDIVRGQQSSSLNISEDKVQFKRVENGLVGQIPPQMVVRTTYLYLNGATGPPSFKTGGMTLFHRLFH